MRLIVYNKKYYYFSITLKQPYYSIYLQRKGTAMVWERAIFSLDSVLLDQLLRGWINGSTEAESNETSSLGYMKIYNPTFKNGRGGFQQQWYR